VEDLHQLTKKIEEKQRLLEEKKMLLEKTQKEYENVIVSMEEEKRKKQMELERQRQEEEAKQRRALYAFKIPQNENWLEEVVMSPRQTLPTRPLTSFSTLAAVMTQRPEKYTTAVLQVLNLNDMPLLFALAKALNETLPNTDIPVLLVFLFLSLFCFVVCD
jgi:hypothetical protein